jgi:hypothetical protein
MFAALEAKNTANAGGYNTVAIVGLDGKIQAETTFAPMATPYLGCIGAILPSSAHVAAGKVFFADASGVVRSLSTSGTVSTVASFPMNSSQQMLSFAVSPDGAKLLATIFTSPQTAYPCDGSPSAGTFTFDAYSAANGGPSRLVHHQSWTKPPYVMSLTGWDAVGPIGTYPTVWASEGGGPGSTLGVYVRVDAATVKPGSQLSDPSKCRVWDSVASGSFVCMSDGVMTGGGTADQRVQQPLSVRGANGTELWHATVTGQNSPFAPYLAADGQHVLICCNDIDLANPHEIVIGRDATQLNLAKGFYARGWLDATTVIGDQGGSQMAYVALKSPSLIVSMGFAGSFVGTVRA